MARFLLKMVDFRSVIVELIVLACSIFALEYNENALNVPQLLLPYTPSDVFPANYTLKAMKGCLRWTSSKPEVATVVPVTDRDVSNTVAGSYQDGGFTSEKLCSRSAMVTATSSSKEKSTAIITAEDDSTGIILRCDVFVDTINRIEIATTTRELLLGETPEVFDVYGYDEEGNLFSSLGSTVFDWYLSPTSQNDSIDPSSVLRFLKFHGSSYETDPEIRALEEKGLLGSSVLMEGINTGEAFVSAKLVHPVYKEIPASTVKLTVVDNIILQPSSDVYILVGTKVHYKVKQLRRGHSKEIAMPSSQYRFQLDKENIATLNHQDSSVTGKELGTVKITLIDNNVAHTKSVRQPTATIHVVQPGSLRFRISPGNSWVLQTGKEYSITVDVYDTKKHKIYVSDDTVLKSTLEEEFVEVRYKSRNHSFHDIKTIKTGQTRIEATLIGVAIKNDSDSGILKLKRPVYGEQPFEIFDELKVNPELVVFPWAGSDDKLYSIQLKASGGSGNYLWNSRNYSFATVSNKGRVKTGSLIGLSKVRVSDKKNGLHFAEATIVVQPPDEMHFLEVAVEAEIGHILELPLSVSAYVNIDGTKVLKVFEDCRQLPLSKSLADDRIFSVVNAPIERSSVVPNSCTLVRLKALKTGFTSLTVSYDVSGVSITAKITIGAYPPLIVVHPKEVATVTLASSEIVALAGGPLPWILDSSGFYEALSAEEDDWVAIQSSERPDSFVLSEKRRDVHFFKVTCKQLTELQLSGQVGNKPTAKNKFPANSVTKLRFLCTPPSSLSLTPDIVLPIIDGEQMTLESCQDANKLIPVRNKRELTVLLIVRDQNGQIFANASSLDIKWSSSDSKLARISQRSSPTLKIKSNQTASVLQTVVLSDQTGAVKIEAKVSGYKEVALYAIGIYDKDSKAKITPPITGTLGLLLVNERRIVPDKIVILNHPQNKAHLKLQDGSQFYRIKMNEDTLGHIQKMTSELVVTPRYSGHFVISVYDICLDSEGPAKAQLTFTDIYSIHVSVADKVGLRETIKAIVQIKDVNGYYLSFRDMKLLNLTPKFSNDIINIKLDESEPKSNAEFVNKASFILEGSAIGITSLTFYAFKSDKTKINSRAKDIQVFPPLQLDPRHILLVAGATFQVQSSGGPRPESTIVFAIENQTVASVSSTGIIHALIPGNTTLFGRAQGLDPHSGNPIVYSKDMIIVEVIRLKGFKIHLATKTIISGNQIGMYATGLSDEGPFTFSLPHPFLEFYWSCSNNEVAELKSVYEKTGVSVEREKDFRVVLSTRKAGETTIKLRVQITSDASIDIIHPGAIMKDEIQLQVFDGLKVLFPENDNMLLPPNVEAKIKTNKDGISRLSYEVIKGCGSMTSPAIVDISSDGLIKTTSSSGTAVVQITSHEDFGLNQTAVLSVEVRSVASITLVSLSRITSSQGNSHSFPLGVNAKFSVSLHDNVGRKFDVSSIQLKHRIQRSDVITVVPQSGNIYTVRAVKFGNAILKIWDQYNPEVADYIRVTVSHGIKPSHDDIHQGDLICLKSTVNHPEGSSIFWSSSNVDIVDVNSKSGIAVAKSPGTCTIYANHGEFITQIELRIHKTTYVQFHPVKDNLITNSRANVRTTQSFPIEMDGRRNQQRDNCANTLVPGDAFTSTLPFMCVLEPDESSDTVALNHVFSVAAKYINGNPMCEVLVNELSRKSLEQISTTEMKLSLHVSLRGKEAISNSIQVYFVPAFYVKKGAIDLSSDKPVDVVSISGVSQQLSSLIIHSENPSVVVIERLFVTTETDTVDLKVKFIDTTSKKTIESTSIIIESGLTGQREKLPISIHTSRKIEQPKCEPIEKLPFDENRDAVESSILFSERFSWVLFYTIIIATVILLIFVYHQIVSFRDRNRAVPDTSFHHSAPPPYQTPYYGSPSGHWTPVSGHERSHSPASGRRPHSVYNDSVKTTPGNRTLFSVGQ